MKLTGDTESVNLETGERSRRVSGDGESRLIREGRIDCVVCGHYAHRKNACKGGMGDYCDCQGEKETKNALQKRT